MLRVLSPTVALAAALLLALACAGSEAQRPDRSAPATEIIEFVPAPASAHISREGYCTGPSAVLSGRADAWRCIDDERISDPCFETDGVITCGVNPIRDDGGYQLRLTDPLPPRPEPSAEPSRFWLLELEDGVLCGITLGGAEQLEGEPVTYGCSDGWLLVGPLVEGHPLTARRIPAAHLRAGRAALDDLEDVAVHRAWR